MATATLFLATISYPLLGATSFGAPVDPSPFHLCVGVILVLAVLAGLVRTVEAAWRYRRTPRRPFEGPAFGEPATPYPTWSPVAWMSLVELRAR